MDELLDQFIIEGRELVQQASDDLIALGSNAGDIARIDSAFRAVHTLKGSVGLFDFAPMAVALHAAEDLLVAMRSRAAAASGAAIDALLDCVGACDAWIEHVASTGGLPGDAAGRARRLADLLQALLPGDRQAAQAPPTIPTGAWVPPLLARAAAALADPALAGRRLTALRYEPGSDCFFLGDDPMALVRAIPGLVWLHVALRDPQEAASLDPFACNLRIEAVTQVPVESLRQSFRFVADQIVFEELPPTAEIAAPEDAAPAALPAGNQTLRVDAQRLDALVSMIGEMIVAKNALGHLAARDAAAGGSAALAAAHADIDRLVGEMHRAVMGMRMVPLNQTFRRFPRLVREIAGQLGKDIRFEMHGGGTEADKTIGDGMFEPLLHILRNAIDHGIEDPARRIASGKPPAGSIALSAVRAGEQIVVTVADDGAGMDPDRIRDVARARNLMSAAAIDALDDDAAIDLIFRPGFSTADAVTAISGRGVGMDAVRTAVEALAGAVTITSSPGKGCTVRLCLPQAIVVTTVMIVRAGTERFGIPIDGIVEIARIPAGRILPVGQGEAFVLRDRTLPLLRLSDLLALADTERTAPEARILILATGDQRIGIEVDGFEGRLDVMLRPLTGLLAGMPGMRSAALLGDGRVLIVLNLAELIG